MQVEAMRKPISPVWSALSGYKVLMSGTPESFVAKVRHVPVELRHRIAAIPIDVLRATTTIHACIAAGGKGVCLSVKPNGGDYDLAPLFGNPDEWVYGGEENGLPISGGVIGNSPLDVAHAGLSGKFLRFFSTNGARAFAAIEDGHVGGVFLASLANVELTAITATRSGFDVIWFVCGGFYGSNTLEDTVCAGRGIHDLVEESHCSMDRLDDEAKIALRTAREYHSNNEGLLHDLRHGQVGHLLREIGREADLDAVIGRGIDPDIWDRMTTTVVLREMVGAVPVFVAGGPA